MQSVFPGRELPEALLVERAQERDEQAFEALVRRHQDAVYRTTVRILVDPSEAHDAAQEALITAWRRLPELADPHTFPAWLHRIAVRRALNVVRVRVPRPAEDPDQRTVLTGPVDHTLSDALREALWTALFRLPPSQRVCWVLREMEEMGYEEIGRAVGATPDAVRGRVHRARIRLMKELEAWR